MPLPAPRCQKPGVVTSPVGRPLLLLSCVCCAMTPLLDYLVLPACDGYKPQQLIIRIRGNGGTPTGNPRGGQGSSQAAWAGSCRIEVYRQQALLRFASEAVARLAHLVPCSPPWPCTAQPYPAGSPSSRASVGGQPRRGQAGSLCLFGRRVTRRRRYFCAQQHEEAVPCSLSLVSSGHSPAKALDSIAPQGQSPGCNCAEVGAMHRSWHL